ncbi:MAG TPA: TonB-dependent receptor, partial [Longimicrobiaceae bacterium]|nr:TonB-dependent receptor [Longimicrobiaceae bacterium]
VTDRVNALEGIVVTGSAAGTARRSLTVGLDVVDGKRLSRRGAQSLPDVLNAAVPGVWAWRQSPSSLVAQYGSVRGASSFGATYPKVYVDGVEAANPLLITEIDPDEVERVEVIRGPQGAALYGSDAISGVINIVTRHESAQDGARTRIRSLNGFAGSAYAANPPTTWEQRLGLRTGSNLASAGLAVTVGHTGAIYSGAGTRRLAAVADGRAVTRNAIFNGSFRISDRRSGTGENPLVSDLYANVPAIDSLDDEPQSVRLYTLATSATVATQGRWTHTVLFGIDGYRLDYLPDAVVPLPIAGDSVLRAARGGGDRGTFRASSTLRLGDGGGAADGSVTFALEHSVLHQRTEITPTEPARTDGPHMVHRQMLVQRPDATVAEWRHDTGLMAQASGSWRDALFATAGVRLERSDGFAGGVEYSTLPMLGLAWVQGLGGGTELKLRSAFGRGIRPPRTPARDHMRWQDRWAAAATLQPESQSGVEVGAELYVGRALSLQATRFDQRVTGLIQDVALRVDTFVQGGKLLERVGYQLQNVGAIDNTGWEMQGDLATGPLTLTGTLALVDSRVRRLAVGYLGELRAGDRILGVPARTASLTAEWEGSGWSGALTATQAWDWINYDRLALATEFARDSMHRARFTTTSLRSFWRAYDGDTDLRISLSRQVRPGIWLVARGENLLGTQVGEPDNLTIRAGRSLLFGVKAEF